MFEKILKTENIIFETIQVIFLSDCKRFYSSDFPSLNIHENILQHF